jgi:hypothetical protein
MRGCVRGASVREFMAGKPPLTLSRCSDGRILRREGTDSQTPPARRFFMPPPSCFKRLWLVLLAIAAAPAAYAVVADAYLCVADMSAGIRFDKSARKWDSTRFNASEKLVVSRASGELAKKFERVVKEVGSSSPKFWCKDDFNQAGYLYCTGLGDFRFNHRNGRYISTYMIGYVTDRLEQDTVGDQEGENTPALTAGKCSPL